MSTSAPAPGRESSKTLLATVLTIPLAISLMLLAFLAPAISSGAKDLPLSVSAPAATQEQLATQLAAAAPGVFDITFVDDAAAVTDAVKEREAVGGIAVGQSGIEVVTASGAGSPYATLLKNLATGLETQTDAQLVAAAKAQGADAATLIQVQSQAASTTSVTVSDVAPLTSEDPSGVAISSLALPIVFGGMISGSLLTIVSRASAWKRALTAVVVAVLGALLAVLVLHTWFGAINGSFWMELTGLALGISAISLTLIGLHSVLGYAGFGLGAVTMLFVANPLSGIATGWQWLPSGWGTFGQMLPVGAAGTWLRSAAYFDSEGLGSSPWVLCTWALCGITLLALGAWFSRRSEGTLDEVQKAALETVQEPLTETV